MPVVIHLFMFFMQWSHFQGMYSSTLQVSSICCVAFKHGYNEVTLLLENTGALGVLFFFLQRKKQNAVIYNFHWSGLITCFVLFLISKAQHLNAPVQTCPEPCSGEWKADQLVVVVLFCFNGRQQICLTNNPLVHSYLYYCKQINLFQLFFLY